MRSHWTKSALVMGFIISTAAQAESLKGQLVELSSVENSVTLRLEQAPPEKNLVSYKVARDARWHICLQDSCIIKKGVEGFSAVNEYAEYGAYGIPHKSYDVTLNLKDNVATGLEVQIVPKVH